MPMRRFSGGRRWPGRLTTAPREADLAAGDRLEAGDAAQHRRLAAARGAEQAGDTPAVNAAVDSR